MNSNNEIVLEAQNISRTYKGNVEVEALKPCNLTFNRGEFVAIIGKSGSGKSTLLRVLGTLDIPDTGTLSVDGKATDKMKDAELARLRRRRIGFVFQDYRLFPEYTAYENIILPIHLDKRREDKEKILEIMEKLGIADCKDKFPSELSGGQQQRVALARALAIEPAVILADEPTGNLDAANSGSVAEILRSASEMYNQTIIMVTHDRQMADYADRILEIKDGVVTE